jgi:hypothetical protein
MEETLQVVYGPPLGDTENLTVEDADVEAVVEE